MEDTYTYSISTISYVEVEGESDEEE